MILNKEKLLFMPYATSLAVSGSFRQFQQFHRNPAVSKIF